MLLFKDLKKIFSHSIGIKYDEIGFLEVYIHSSKEVYKGLFVLLESIDADEKVKEALYNGAVGALWPRNQTIPSFLPNHFPLFLVEDPLQALHQIIDFSRDTGKLMNISLSYNETHKEKTGTYDSAVIEGIELLKQKLSILNMERGD